MSNKVTDELMALVEAVLRGTDAVRRPQPELRELRTAIEAALAEAHPDAYNRKVAEPQSDPVAWVLLERWVSGYDWPDDCFGKTPEGTGEGWFPLYLHPAAEEKFYLTRWVMHDNHTFTKLPADNDAALVLALECFDRDGGYLMLCGSWSDELKDSGRARPRPAVVHAGNRDHRKRFEHEAAEWLKENPDERGEKP